MRRSFHVLIHGVSVDHRAIHIGFADVDVGPFNITRPIVSAIIVAVISVIIPSSMTRVDVDRGIAMIAVATVMIVFDNRSFTTGKKHSGADESNENKWFHIMV